MANYATLKAAISQVIKENGNKEITGAVMQTTLLAMVDSMASGYTFAGVATPSTSAGTPDENVFWIGGAGSYSNFGATTINVPTGCICIFIYNGSFASSILYVGGVVDISKLTNTSYASLSQALADVPSFLQVGGLEVMYQDSTSGKYVKYRLMTTSWSNIITDWRGVDAVPTAGSDNLVKSGGVYPTVIQTNKVTSTSIINYISGGYVNTSNDLVDINNIISDSNFSYAIVQCTFGDIFTISAQGGVSPRAWAFIDNVGNVIVRSETSINIQGMPIAAPLNSAYLIINTSNNLLPSYKGLYRNKITENIDKSGISPIYFTHGGYIKNNEGIVNIHNIIKDTTYSCIVVSCEEGEYFTISAKGGNSPRAYSFIDSAGNILEKSDNGEELYNSVIMAPQNSYYLVLNNLINDGISRYSFKGRTTKALSKIIDNIDKNVGIRIPVYKMSSGDIDSAGTNKEGNTRIRTDFIKIDGSVTISTKDSNYDFVTYVYDENYVFQSIIPFTQYYKFNDNIYIRLKFRNINTPSTDISSEIENIHNCCIIQPVLTEGKTSNVLNIYSGGINSVGMDEDADKTRCRTGYIPVSELTTVSMNAAYDYELLVYKYDDNGAFVSLIEGYENSKTFEHNGYIRVKFRNNKQNMQDISAQTAIIQKCFSISRSIDFGDKIANISLKYNNDFILAGKVCISDTNMISASAAQNVVDEEKGIVYCTYLASDENYGEQRKYIILTKFSLANPNNSEHFVVAANGTTIGGISIVLPFEPNIIRIGDTLLISLYNEGQYYVRRFDMETSTLSNTLEKLKIVESGVTNDFNDTNISDIYSSRSLNFGSYTIFSCRPVYHNDKWWSVITTNGGGAILCTSVDGITWTLSYNIEGEATYESVIAFVGDYLYNISRGSTTMYVSSNEGNTWTSYLTVPAFSTRPQLMEYKGNLLSIIPNPNNVEHYIGWSGRNIIDILMNSNRKLRLSSKYGIVYPSIFRVYNDVYFIYSNGMLFGSNYQSDGKDALYAVRVGELFEDEKFVFSC